MNAKTRQLMREARESKNMKQSDIAKKLGVTLQAVSSWERGKNDIDMNSFVAYCQVCEADFTKILKQAYGDPTQMQDFYCTPDEAELIRRYRFIDERGKKTVRTVLDAEYNDALASLPEESPNATGTG